MAEKCPKKLEGLEPASSAAATQCGDAGSGVTAEHESQLRQIKNYTHEICDGTFGKEKFEAAAREAARPGGDDKALLAMICNTDPHPAMAGLGRPLTNVCAQYFGVMLSL